MCSASRPDYPLADWAHLGAGVIELDTACAQPSRTQAQPGDVELLTTLRHAKIMFATLRAQHSLLLGAGGPSLAGVDLSCILEQLLVGAVVEAT